MKINSMEINAILLSSDVGLAAQSLPSIAKQDTNFSSQYCRIPSSRKPPNQYFVVEML